MKNYSLALIVVGFLFTPVWAQNDSVAAPAAQSETKRASHVIDDENLGAALANSGDVQNASAAQVADKSKKNPDFVDDDGNALTAKEEIDRRKEEEKGWLESIEVCKKRLEGAETDKEREIWRANIAATQIKLAETRKYLAKAEAAQAQEQNPQNPGVEPAGALDNAGNTLEQTGTTPTPE